MLTLLLDTLITPEDVADSRALLYIISLMNLRNRLVRRGYDGHPMVLCAPGTD